MSPAPDPDEDDTNTPSGASRSSTSTRRMWPNNPGQLGEHEAVERFLTAVTAASGDLALTDEGTCRLRVLTSVLCHTLLRRADIAMVTMRQLSKWSGVAPSRVSRVLRKLDGGHLRYQSSTGPVKSTVTVPVWLPADTSMPAITCPEADMPTARARTQALLASVGQHTPSAHKPCTQEDAERWLILLGVCSWLLATGEPRPEIPIDELAQAVNMVGSTVRPHSATVVERAHIVSVTANILAPVAEVAGRRRQNLHIRLRRHVLELADEIARQPAGERLDLIPLRAPEAIARPHDPRRVTDQIPAGAQQSTPDRPTASGPRPSTNLQTTHSPTHSDTTRLPESDSPEGQSIQPSVHDQPARLQQPLQRGQEVPAGQREEARLLRELPVAPRWPEPAATTHTREQHRALRVDRDLALRALAGLARDLPGDHGDRDPRQDMHSVTSTPARRPPPPAHPADMSSDEATVSTLEDTVAALPPHLRKAAVIALTHLLDADRAATDDPNLPERSPRPTLDQHLHATARNESSLWAARHQLLHTAWTGSQAAERLGMRPARIMILIFTGELLALQLHGDTWLPAWQFHLEAPDGRLPGICHVRAAFPHGLLELSSWMITPNPALDGRTPRQALVDRDVDRVVAAADGIGT